jgi:tetratricopeptide (TPR) repeat protein/O-antigen ligase
MKKKEKKIREYLEERRKIIEEREIEAKKIKQKRVPRKKKSKKSKDYALNELPEIETLKKFFTKFRNKKNGDNKSGFFPFNILFSKKKGGNDLANGKEKAIFFLDRGIFFCIYATIFVFSLLVFPATLNSLEMPKELIFFFLTGLALIFWLVKIILQNRVRLKRSFLFVPISIFLLIYFLSSVFSIYPDRSFWGHNGDESSSLIMLVTCIFYFFIVINHISSRRSVRKILFFTLLSGFFASLYSIFQIWGIHIIELDKLENRSVNTIGTFRASAVYFAGLAVLASGLAVSSSKKIYTFIYLFFILSYLFFLSAVFYKGVWLLFIIAAGLVLVLGITQKRMGKNKIVLSIPSLVFVFGLATLLLGKPLFDPGVISQEMLLSPSNSAKVAVESIKEKPFLGFGPNTFDYCFEIFRPDLGQLSSVNIHKPANYFIMLVATVGLLTLLAYFFLLFVLVRFVIANAFSIFLGENKRGDNTTMIVSIFWLFLTVAGFVCLNNVLLIFLWWLALAVIDIGRPVSSIFSMGFGEKENKNSSLRISFAKSSFLLSIILITFSVLFIVLLHSAGKRYLANYYFQKALDKNFAEQDLAEIENNVKKAVRFDKKRDNYLRNAAVVSLSVAQHKINEEGDKLSGEGSKHVSTYINEAINLAEKSIEINSYDFENYRNLAWIYQAVGDLDESFNEKSLSFYKKSLEFSRDNPNLYYQLGNLYLKLYRKRVDLNLGEQNKMDSKAKEYLLLSEENLKKALDENKYHFEANLLLVATYELLGEGDAAFSKAKENWNMFFGNSQAGFSLATYYYRKGKCELACPILETVLEDSQDYANAHYLLGICLAKLGNLEGALNHMEEVKLYNPNVEFLDEIISDLRKEKIDFLVRLEGGGATSEIENIENNTAEEDESENNTAEEDELENNTAGENESETNETNNNEDETENDDSETEGL